MPIEKRKQKRRKEREQRHCELLGELKEIKKDTGKDELILPSGLLGIQPFKQTDSIVLTQYYNMVDAYSVASAFDSHLLTITSSAGIPYVTLTDKGKEKINKQYEAGSDSSE